MKKNEKIMITLLVIVSIIIIAVLLVIRSKGNEKNENSNVSDISEASSNENNTEQGDVQVDEFVSQSPDGVKSNTSNKIYETKEYQGLEVQIKELTQVNNVTRIFGTIKNTSNTVHSEGAANLKILNKDGNEIIELGIMIRELAPGEEAQLITSATFDYVNAYDYVIE